jgi:hypothetical protein
MTQIIEVIISPDGQTKLETKGFVGASCRDASRVIEQALGRQAGEQLTVEFHQTQPTQQIARGEN